MKIYLRFLLAGHLFFFFTFSFAQSPTPFEGCPGVSVAITRPGFNNNLVPHQIFLIDTTGAITPTGDPIDLQINAFGLDNEDGFLYGMFQAFNVANPSLARVGKNGKFETVGTILGPPVDQFKVAIVNTAAATMDGDDNYYFTAAVVDLQNILLPPQLFVGKIKGISKLHASNDPLNITYKQITLGTCLPELLNALKNPLTGILQDLAFDVSNGLIYTYLPGANGTGGTIGWFDPSSSDPVFNCITPSSPNPATADLSGLFFNVNNTLFILTTDGKYYKANVQTGSISLVTQTSLPLQDGNLRGDMASCVGVAKKKLVPFEGCPDLALAITRPGINSTVLPFQIFKINPSNGSIQAMGHLINLQINAFGLDNVDGFLYGMHETSDIFGPTLARVDRNGDFNDIGTLSPPNLGGSRKGIVNTAAATMDGRDNYYFTAVVVDTANILDIPRLYLGTIKNVSKLNPGDHIQISYRRIFLGTCIADIIQSLSDPKNGLFQDIAYNPKDGRIYTYIQSHPSPAPGDLASFRPASRFMVLNCMEPAGGENEPTQDLSGMHADKNGQLFILTIDGKYYRGNPNNGKVMLIAQTDLPLQSNNLRGDMASCVAPQNNHREGEGDDDGDDLFHSFDDDDSPIKVLPNPVNGDEITVIVNSAIQTSVELKIMDVSGHVNSVNRQMLVGGDNQLKVPVKNLKNGMYAVVVIFPSGKTSATKFIRMQDR
jgi:hypothetical protein